MFIHLSTVGVSRGLYLMCQWYLIVHLLAYDMHNNLSIKPHLVIQHTRWTMQALGHRPPRKGVANVVIHTCIVSPFPSRYHSPPHQPSHI